MALVSGGSQHERTALVLYGSETGTAQDVAEELGALMERLHFTTKVVELNMIDINRLAQTSVIIVVISTTGQGDLPANTQLFWKKLLRKRLPPDLLSGVQFTTFGLGDSSYPKFNWAARKLHKRLVQLGANEFHPRGESDAQHPEGIDGTFLPWVALLRKYLLGAYDYPAGLSPIPDDVLLEPRWTLELDEDPGDVLHTTSLAQAIVSADCGGTMLNGNRDHQQLLPRPSGGSSRPTFPPDDILPIPGSVIVTLDRNDRITPSSHWQDVRWLTLSTSKSLDYEPGDVLTIFPKNFPQDVDHMISLMGWSDVADAPLRYVSTRPSVDISGGPPPIPYLPPTPRLTLRNLLTHHLDITAIPRRSFFSLIAHFTADPMHKDRLLEFTKPEFLDELFDYTTRARRSILEVLHDFQSVKIPWHWVGSVIPVLKGRQFSIASGGRLKRTEAEPYRSKFDLLVGIVKYRTVIKKVRRGVCSRYLASLAEGTQISVLLRRGALNIHKTEARKPVVMVAPGTGVAPMRSLLWERLSWIEEERYRGSLALENGHGPVDTSGAENMLLFGSRNREADFYFCDEWEELKSKMKLQVYTAFSRDQKEKIYVQDIIREQAKLVYRHLHFDSGILYLCGASGKMPQAVREALIEVFQAQGDLPRKEAEKELLDMEMEGRYKQETW